MSWRRHDGVTILLSSHLLDEVQRVCDRVAIFSRGKLVAEERVDKLIAGQEKLRFTATSKELPVGRAGRARLARWRRRRIRRYRPREKRPICCAA